MELQFVKRVGWLYEKIVAFHLKFDSAHHRSRVQRSPVSTCMELDEERTCDVAHNRYLIRSRSSGRAFAFRALMSSVGSSTHDLIRYRFPSRLLSLFPGSLNQVSLTSILVRWNPQTQRESSVISFNRNAVPPFFLCLSCFFPRLRSVYVAIGKLD